MIEKYNRTGILKKEKSINYVDDESQ